MRLYFALTTTALVIAALCGAPLAWDGSYYLLKALDAQAPFTPHHRLINVLLQGPALLVSRYTDNMAVLRVLFELGYVAIPLSALAASWWIVRRRAPDLFAWAALGIGLGALPGQFNMNSEAIAAVQLFWPALLALLVGMPGGVAPVAAVLVALMFLAHPIAGALFVAGAGTAALVALVAPRRRRVLAPWIVGLGVLAVLRLVVARDSYETSELTAHAQVLAFEKSVLGWPLLALVCAWFAAVALFMARRRGFAWRGGAAPAYVAACVLVAMTGTALLPWALDPRAWANAIDFKGWVLAASLPFMTIAVVDGVAGRAVEPRPPPMASRHRRGIVHIVGAVFLVVLAAQSLSFARVSHALGESIARGAAPCLATSLLAAVDGTALAHWSLPSYALLQEGKTPRRLVLGGNGCGEAQRTGRLRITSWDDSLGRGWFDLRPVRARIRTSPLPGP